MNISSVIVIPHPDQVEAVQVRLRQLDGVEVQAVSPAGKMIVTLETGGDRETAELFEKIGLLAGVLSVSMVYHQREPEPDTIISVEA